MDRFRIILTDIEPLGQASLPLRQMQRRGPAVGKGSFPKDVVHKKACTTA
jgi:hypothetical protein